jgi:hypothetical protein
MYTWIQFFGAGDGAERALYADFLDEASVLLENKSLKEAAKQFRLSHKKWIEFADVLLPSRVPAFRETKSLLTKKHQLLVENKGSALEEVIAINKKLKKIEADMAKNFPLSPSETADLRSELREHVLGIAQSEKGAVDALQASMK